jgi:anti-sigma factor RsiW
VNGPSCDEFADQASELALGLLSGDERAAALAHLAGCPACRANLDELSRVADALLLVAPRAEPPVGFESRVLSRLATENAAPPSAQQGPIRRRLRSLAHARPRASRRWIGPLSVAAALAIAALTVGLVVGRQTASRAPNSAIRTATVWADGGKSTCHVVAIPGHHGHGAELLLRLDELTEGPDAYPVLVQPANSGQAVPVGVVTVVKGQGNFDTVVPASVGKIRGVRVLEEDGRLRYQATFPPI